MVKKIVVEFDQEQEKKTLELTDEQAESLYRFLDKLYGKNDSEPIIIKEREMVPYPMYPKYPWNEPITYFYTDDRTSDFYRVTFGPKGNTAVQQY